MMVSSCLISVVRMLSSVIVLLISLAAVFGVDGAC